LLTNEERKNFLNKIKTGTLESHFKSTFYQAKSLISLRKKSSGFNDLAVLKSAAIAEINEELLKEPEIKNSELEPSDQNWETAIQNSTEDSQIKLIKSQVLADIKNKRADKEEENEILSLLAQAETKNDYEELAEVISEIKKLFSTNTYQKHEQEIDQQEARLKQLNSQKYQKNFGDLLDQLAKDGGLNDSNTDAETKKALEKAKNSGKPEDKKAAEEQIAQNVAKNDLVDVLTKISKRLEKGSLTTEEQETFIEKLLEITTKNRYAKSAYQAQKSEVDRILAKLRGKNQGSTQTPLREKVILSLMIISLPVIVITGILLWRKKKQRGK
jgi:hypothetical protein